MGLFVQTIGALAIVYGLSHACNEFKQSLKPEPYVSGAVEESKEYTVWKGNDRMTLPGYELKRRPHDMSIDEFVRQSIIIAGK